MLGPYDIPVDVICLFTKEKKIIPLKAKIPDEEENLHEIKFIEYKEVAAYDNIKFSTNKVFICKFIVNDNIKTIKLIYNSNESQWAYRRKS